MTAGVYLIQNTVSLNFYIGSSVDVESRWAAHRCELRKGTHHCHALQKAWVKYGEGCFILGILEVCGIDSLRMREQHFIDKLDPVYNSTKFVGRPSALNRDKARKHAIDVLSKVVWTEERRRKAADRVRNRPPPGCPWTPEQRFAQAERCRNKMKQLWSDPEYKLRVGKKISEAKRRK